METNERAIQYQAAEHELLQLIAAVDAIEDGDLKAVEETIFSGIFRVGKKLMEGKMTKEKEPIPPQDGRRMWTHSGIGSISKEEADHDVW